MNPKQRLYRLGAIVFGVVALLPSLACIFWPIYEPYPWEPDSSAFYFFRYKTLGEDEYNVKLMKHVIDSKEQVLVADLGTRPDVDVGAARRLKSSRELAWLQTGSATATSEDARKKSEDETFLVVLSLEEKKVEREVLLSHFADDEYLFAFHPTRDLLYYLWEKGGGVTLSQLDIGSGEISSRSVPVEEPSCLQIFEEGDVLYLGIDEQILRYDLQSGELTLEFVMDGRSENFFMRNDHLLTADAMFVKKDDEYLRKPFPIMEHDLPYDEGGIALFDGYALIQYGDTLYLVDFQTENISPLLRNASMLYSYSSTASISPSGEYVAFRLILDDPDNNFWLTVIAETESLVVRDVILPLEKDVATEEWRGMFAEKALLLQWMRAPGALDAIEEVLSWEDADEKLREAVVASLDSRDAKKLKGMLAEEELELIESRPTVRQALRAIRKNDAETIDAFLKSSAYHLKPGETQPVFEKLLFHPDTSEKEGVKAYEQFRQLRALAEMRARYN